MTAEESKIGQSMRRDWDERAPKDPYFYTASWRQDWDEDSFLRSGEDDYVRFVESTLKQQIFETADKAMLELGCGAGRMTRSFAQRFKRVIAFDVSQKMIERGRFLHNGIPGVTWLLGNGTDLSMIPSEPVDFIFSYLVLQHLPEERLVHTHVSEMMRVLAKGGWWLFQFNGSNEHNMNWKGRTAWGIIDLLWSMRLRATSKRVANLLGLDPQMGGKSWHGVAVSSNQISATILSRRGLILAFADESTSMAWCCARKAQDFTKECQG